MNDRYLKVLTRFCYGLFYYKEQFRFCVNFDRVLKIVLAVITASSVASWRIWEKYSLVWSVIIGISQLLLIISALLPYKDRITKLRELRVKLADIYEDMENQWFDVCEKKLSGDEINDIISEYKERWRKTESKYMKDDILPRWRWMINKAKNYTVAYVRDMIVESDFESEVSNHEDPTVLSKKQNIKLNLDDKGIEKITSSIYNRLPKSVIIAEAPCIADKKDTPR